VIAEADSRVSLPNVCVDQNGAVRHATHELLRREFRFMNLLIEKSRAPGIRQAAATFRSVCAEWPQQPVHGQVVESPLDPPSLMLTVRRLAARVKGRQGIIALAPIPVGTVMTALLQQGVAVPRQAELVAVFPTPESVHVFPPPTYYPLPVNRLVKVLTDISVHYFATGNLPRGRRVISVEVVRPRESAAHIAFAHHRT
jgi:DNA-binding LacI/PurR family transcriptional regulator